MDKLKTTAGRLDTVFRILQTVFLVGTFLALAGLTVIVAFFLFRLEPEQIGTGYNTLELGFLELTLAESVIPDKRHIVAITAVELALLLPVTLLARTCMKRIRRILTPMQEGLPFWTEAADHLKKLALISLVLGVLLNCMELVNQLMTVSCYSLTDLLVSDQILSVTATYEFDLGFLVVCGVFLLLSHIFRYGAQLQQLSDETL